MSRYPPPPPDLYTEGGLDIPDIEAVSEPEEAPVRQTPQPHKIGPFPTKPRMSVDEARKLGLTGPAKNKPRKKLLRAKIEDLPIGAPVKIGRPPEGFQNDSERGLVPIAANTKGVATPDAPYDRFFQQIGAIDQLEMLEDALSRSRNAKAGVFLDLLSTPRGRRMRLSTCAKTAGITLSEMIEIWRDSRISDGLMTLVNGIPTISGDMVQDARSTMVCCPRCDGHGKVTHKDVEVDCPQCEGSGKIRKAGDKETRKQIFEAVGITGKKAGINVFTGPVSVESVIDDLDRSDSIETTCEPS